MANPMTPKQIRHALDNIDITQKKIADECNVSRSAVSQVINGNAKSHKIRCCIAEKLGTKVDTIWTVKSDPTRPGPSA